MADIKKLAENYWELCKQRGSQISPGTYEQELEDQEGHPGFRPAEYGWFTRLTPRLWHKDYLAYCAEEGHDLSQRELDLSMEYLYALAGLGTSGQRTVTMRAGRPGKRTTGINFERAM